MFSSHIDNWYELSMSFRDQTIQISVYIEIKNSHKFKSTNCVIQGLLQFFHAIGVNTLISNELYLCIIISVVFWKPC